jgi:OOP family OmpA-OmpF porin
MKPQTTHPIAGKRWSRYAASWVLSSITACAVMLGLSGMAHAQDKTGNKSFQALAQAYDLQNEGVAAGQSRIIFYSPTTTSLPGAATVYINGRYHASLIAGGYTPVCLLPGKVELGARQIDINSRANKDGLDSMTQLTLQSGQNQFVRVNGDSRKNIALMPVASSQAEKEIAQTRLQMHTISRVPEALECVKVTPTAAVSVTPVAQAAAAVSARQMQLSGDTLFAFDRADAAGLTQQGLRAIDQLGAQINAEFSHIDRVHVIGHTDPFGSDAYNDKLSAQRALTVRQHIEGRRQVNAPVTSEGRGKRELVVTECGKEQNAANIACNQPNRRVTIDVTGTARAQ